MNKKQRKELEKIQDRISAVQSDIQSIRDDIEEIRDDEESKKDNLPEQFQYGEMGDKMQEGIDQLECLMDEIDQADYTLQEVYDGINELM